ncbi:rhomboid-related protein 2 [Eurytemora carolleeae]|uniref:rhomboid-related protein 2 n=1 Tax=Eurytemora carolleeae TaxID=1294199 RepID=UPI000C7932B0|nr:rhomboid-related protein 2 [Eurytemora carolleeae]|eukprot:XP_023327586.1 rhomboid-related protein 2-like [Eurytemora affinis]
MRLVSCFSMARDPECVDALQTCYSDSDEEDLRTEQLLLRDEWRNLFDQFDPEGFGEIPWTDFFIVLASPRFKEHVSDEKIDRLLELAYQVDRQIVGSGDFHIALEKPMFSQMTSFLSQEMLADPRDRKYYSDMYRCWPPPVFILMITGLELGVFIYYWIHRNTYFRYVNFINILDSVLAYCPGRSVELWRYISYFMVHSSWWHLIFNLGIQLVLGLPLEMVHGSGRVATIYMSGVLAGSLASSLLDPEVCLVGASGGVYVLLSAHMSNLLLNYTSMDYGIMRLIALIFVASVEVGVAVYGRYADDVQVSYLAHIWGCVAGATVGLVVLKNFKQRLWERWLWWLALSLYTVICLVAIIIIFYRDM